MSHEIRTPMNGIVGFASLLDNDDLSALDKRRYIKLINISIKQLLTIINDIIDISKIESEQLPLHKVVCNVNLILDDLKIFFASSDERQIKSGIQIITEFGLNETESTIETDDVRLNQILTNLIGNALKFTNKGFIKIGYRYTLKNEKPYLEFYVEDTGKGIAQDKLNIIFDRFRQEDESHTRKFGGTGLGLAICRGLLQLLDGEIWVTSMEGKGSTFYFTIPYTPANKKTVNITASKNISTNYFWKNKIILVVEDVDIVFEYINEIIEATGAKCIHTKDGQSAVNICLNNNEIDLVLMDIQLPVMNGYDASKIISEKKPNLPIIAQTAYALTGDREKTLTSGCVDYISKPIKKDVLLNTIQKYIFKKSEKNETDF
jgi:CheY-like chemotaxis protein